MVAEKTPREDSPVSGEIIEAASRVIAAAIQVTNERSLQAGMPCDGSFLEI
jgi:hypothetical protein